MNEIGTHKKVGFAIVGLGELTETQLLPAFEKCKLAQPTALVSDDNGKLKELSEKYNIISTYSYDDLDSIEKDPHVDVVYIVLPNAMHKEFTIRSAIAKKHVLCEKPMATNVADAQEMIDICKNENKKLMIAYRVQYEPHNQLIKNWVQNKVFGETKIIECFNGEFVDDPSQWRFRKELSGGGVLMDLGIYCINTIRFLTENEPQWVFANMHRTPGDERFKEVEETILFQLGFQDGLLASCGASYSTDSYQRYRCFTNAKKWFGMNPAFSYNNLKIEMPPAENGKPFPLPAVEDADQFALIMDHMAECVLNDKQPNTPGEEGLKDHYIIEALYKSAKEKRVVMLEEIKKNYLVPGI